MRTGDVIVYTAQSTLHKNHGLILKAAYSRETLNSESIEDEWFQTIPIVIDFEDARARALEKLDGLDRLVLGL